MLVDLDRVEIALRYWHGPRENDIRVMIAELKLRREIDEIGCRTGECKMACRFGHSCPVRALQKMEGEDE